MLEVCELWRSLTQVEEKFEGNSAISRLGIEIEIGIGII
jgi:hypothetical protein